MPSITQLREEVGALRKNLHDIFAAHDDISSIPADEAKKIKPMNDELTAKVKLLEEAEELDGIKSRVAPPAGVPEPIRNQGIDTGGRPAPAVKSIGQILNESTEYKSFRDGNLRTAVIEIPEAEAKTLITLSTINNLASRDPGIQPSAQETRTVGDLMLQGTTDNNILSYYVESTFTNAAVEVAEGAAKPESALGFTERTDNVRKIATWIPMTKESMDDVKGLESYVRGRLMFMVERREEAELLTGDGIAPNIQGIVNRSGIQTQAKGADPTPDAIYKAMTLIMANAFADPDAFVCHPLDWQDIRLLRTADGIYIFGSPQDPGVNRIWGLPVRVTTAMTQNTGLVGAFKPHAERVRREGITVTLSTEHSTYFTENKVAILAEERLALKVYRPAAFATVTGI